MMCAVPENYAFDKDNYYVREMARAFVAQHGLQPAATLARQRAEQDALAEESDHDQFWRAMAEAIDA